MYEAHIIRRSHPSIFSSRFKYFHGQVGTLGYCN